MGVLDATAMGSPQLGPLSMGLPHAEVPLSTVVAAVEGSPQGSPQPLESVGKEVISTWQGYSGIRENREQQTKNFTFTYQIRAP